MKNFLISRRYSKALVLVGQEDGKAEQYREELDGFVSLMEQHQAFEIAITNPLYPAQDRKKMLETVVDKIGLSDVPKSFLMLLFDKQRFNDLIGILESYRKLVDELKGIVRADLVSASKLPEETVEKIRTSLSNMTGKTVVLDISEDPSLIGGVMTRVGDIVLDGSIKTQLANMQESLKKGERV